jgi:hypothetical protein
MVRQNSCTIIDIRRSDCCAFCLSLDLIIELKREWRTPDPAPASMTAYSWIPFLVLVTDLIIRIGFSIRILMRARPVGVTFAWLFIIHGLPFAGALLYLLFGENRIGERRLTRAREVLRRSGKWHHTLRYQASRHGWSRHRRSNRSIGRHAPSPVTPRLPETG